MHINTDKPAIDQLWNEVRGLIEFSNAKMKSILGLFGIEEGTNRLSPFAYCVTNPSDLKAQIIQFFKRPTIDKTGHGQLSTAIENFGVDDEDGHDEEEDMENNGTDAELLSPEIIARQRSEINTTNNNDGTVRKELGMISLEKR
jgi:hypothetical protein